MGALGVFIDIYFLEDKCLRIKYNFGENPGKLRKIEKLKRKNKK